LELFGLFGWCRVHVCFDGLVVVFDFELLVYDNFFCVGVWVFGVVLLLWVWLNWVFVFFGGVV